MVIRSIVHLLKLDVHQVKRVAGALNYFQLRHKLPTLGEHLKTKPQRLRIHAGVLADPYTDFFRRVSRIQMQFFVNRLQNRIGDTHFVHLANPDLTNSRQLISGE
jgi:hypothetical protein